MIETHIDRDLASTTGTEWMSGGGEMGRRMREFDWTQSTLGTPRRWPASLKAATRILLASREPVCIWWGADCALVFNDACAPLLGEYSASALGQPAPAAWLDSGARVNAGDSTYAHSISPVPGEDGGLGGVFCAFFDVSAAVATERKLVQEVQSLTRLHDLTLRLGGMTELGPILQAILDTAVETQDADFGLVWLQDRETQALVVEASRNWDPQSLRTFNNVMPGPAGGSVGNAFEQRRRWVIEDVEVDEGYKAFRHIARTVGYRAIHSTPIVTRAGNLLGVISVHYAQPRQPLQRDMQMADVCARHAADAIESFRGQAAIRESERLHRAIGESINYGVWVCDGRGHQTYTSESFLRLTGLTAEQCAGEGWVTVLHPDDRERTLEAWRHWMAAGGEWDFEHRIRGADGQWHAVLARGVPVRNDQDDIVGWAGINLDIARLKQVEHELRELDERKNEFLATLAHELRNPLAPLRNGLELIKLAGTRPGTIDKAREMMERQLAQMVRLVDDLLDVSRVSSGKIDLRRERIALAAVLRNAMETSTPLMQGRNHQFVTHIPAGPLVVDADLTRLSQVFWNLLSNAAKYTEPGGRIELTVTALGDHVEIAVRDNGIGIPVDMHDRIFDTFTQVDRAMDKSQGGLGIGLSIAKRLAEMHHGSIRVSSRGHGQGTEFVVRLPLVAPGN